MKSRIKMFLPLLIALFLIPALLGISGCGGSDSGTNSSQNGAQGSGVVYADAKSKSSVEVTYVLNGVGSPKPSATITIKNISEETIEFDNWNEKVGTYSVQVISTDKAGNSLDNEQNVFWPYLRPKEMKSLKVDLFASDETSGCRISVYYRPVPQIRGTVIEAPSSVTVNHYIKVSNDIDTYIGCGLVIEVKNISPEPLGRQFNQNGHLVYEEWSYKVSLKDVAGNTFSSTEVVIASASPDRMFTILINPGETKTYYPSFENHRITEANSYEIAIYKRIHPVSL